MVDIPVKRDRRIARTQQLLSDALMELVVERGYNDITIQEITDRANVSRATFYLHYKDKDELLFSSMEKTYDALVADHMARMPADLTQPQVEEIMCEAGDYEHVAAYADFYRAMISKDGSVGFVLRVMSYLAQAIQPLLETQAEQEGTEPKVPVELIAAFCSGAQIGMMRWWLENDLKYTPEQMARMQYMLSAQGLAWALGGAKAEAKAERD
jgi:AcrR family transcriptional regulator